MPTINIKTRQTNINTATEGIGLEKSGFKTKINSFIRMFSTIDIFNKAEVFVLSGQTFIGTFIVNILNQPIEQVNLPIILQFVIDQLNSAQAIFKNGAIKLVNNNGVCVISNSSPCTITRENHRFLIGTAIMFNSTESLPTGITEGIPYYVISDGYGVNTFQISETLNGIAVNTTSSGTGNQTCGSLFVLNMIKNMNPVYINGKASDSQKQDLRGIIISATPYQRKLRTLGYYDSYLLADMDYDNLGVENTLEVLETYT